MKTTQRANDNVFEQKSGRGWWQLLGLALGATFALLLVPGIGWLIRAQSLPELLTSPRSPFNPRNLAALAGAPQYRQSFAFSEDAAAQVAQAVATRYANYPYTSIHYSTEVTFQDSTASLTGLREVHQRFPSSPVVQAAYLRYASQYLGLNRPEESWLQGKGPAPVWEENYWKSRTPEIEAEMREYEMYAREGERLDPNNAFFPMMLAAVQFARYQDKEALESVARAADKTVWNDYTYEEVKATFHLQEELNGYTSNLSRWTTLGSLMLPHYARIRSIARQVVYQAVQQELAGNRQGGLALRGRMMRIGCLLRDQSRIFIGTRVGQAIFNESMARPGGAPERPISRNQRARKQAGDAYVAYLRANLAGAEADWVAAQRRHNAEIPQVIDTFLPSIPLMRLWIVNQGFVAELIAFLLIGLGIASFRFVRRFDMRPPARLSASVAWGIFMGVVASLFLLMPALTDSSGKENMVAMAALLFYIAILSLLAPRVGAQSAAPLMRSLMLTALSVIVLIWVMIGQLQGLNSYFQRLLPAQDGAQSAGQGATNLLFAALCVFLLPLLLAFALAIVSRIRRIPIAFGVVNGFSRGTLPILCFLLLGYLGSVFVTTRCEADLNVVQASVIENEAGYYRQQHLSHPLSFGEEDTPQ